MSTQRKKEQEGKMEQEEGASSPFYSGSGLPGCSQVTVGVEFRQNAIVCIRTNILLIAG
jgi:hypothetical protein